MRKIAVGLLALLLCACASGPSYQAGTVLPGRIISLADGTVLSMQYVVSTGTGTMTATNPVTGEVFQGSYTAVLETHVTQHVDNSFWGSDDDNQSVETSDVAQGSAVLVGNKGTVLSLKLHVKVGTSSTPPTGYGEGEDNKGVKYSVQF